MTKGSSTIVELHHMITSKGYKIRLKLACGHEETIWGMSHPPKLGDDQLCQTCMTLVLKRLKRKGQPMAVRNLAGVEYIELEAIDINDFHPKDDDDGEPTEVHLCLTPKAPAGTTPPLLVMRFKGRHTLDQIVAALQEHADRVFGKPS